ncbi:MAG TPA: YfcE family phosphodiesterase [Methanobacteriaceae archaeon]|nr:YfcE family phosphodiesterase [Methanobacteriaceae archaeon]
MLIGLISDTHIPERASGIPKSIFEIFEDVEMIFHAGDLVSLDVKDVLNELAPTTCVQGNMDRYYGLKLPERKLMEIEGVRIGLHHGEVFPRGDTQQLRYIGLEMGAEVLITGHTHSAFINQLDDLLLLNPGSPTVPRLSEPSVMLMNVEQGKVEAQIITLGKSPCKVFNYPGRGI